MENIECKSLLAAGKTVKEIELFKSQKAFRDQLSMYLFIERSIYGVEPDNACQTTPIAGAALLASSTEIGIMLAESFEGLGRRSLAIMALKRALSRNSSTYPIPVLYLMMAKLLFRDNQNLAAENALLNLLEFTKITEPPIINEDIADAYYILGWIAIHADNHSKAYRIWREGHEIVLDNRLMRQRNKVECWSNINRDTDCATDDLQALIGELTSY